MLLACRAHTRVGTFLAIFGLLACQHTQRPASHLVIMQTEAPRSMDPADHTATYTSAVLDPIYEGLTQFNRQLEIEPCLAETWRSDANGTGWTIKLRPSITFHDGTPLDANAVVASFERLLDPKRGLAVSGNVRTIVNQVSAIGPLTVHFTLKRPYAAFPRLLAITPIVSPTEDRKRDLGRKAVGTGPYQFVEWKTGEHVLEKRNEHYWRNKPNIEQIEWIWNTEPALMNMAIQAGEVDLVNPLPPIFAQALQRNPKVRLIEGQSSAVFWVALNMKSKPLDDIRVRRALNYATDRASLIASQLRGYGIPANSPLAPADFGYDERVKGYPYDISKAKDLLSEAGYAHGFTLNIAVLESQVNIAQALQGMWAKVNVVLNIQQMESGVFAQSIFGSPEEKARQELHCVLASWTSRTLDADYQLGPLYRTKSWSPTGANLGFYSNRQLDALLDEASAELDTAKRKAIYFQAQQIISDDAPHVLLYYARDLAAEGVTRSGLWLFPGGEVQVDMTGRN